MAGARVNWLAVRTAYVVKGWTAQKCSEEFNVSRPTISMKAAKEGWTAERDKLRTNATAMATAAIAAPMADAVKDIREDHANLVRRLHEVLNGADEDIAEAKPGRSRAEVRRLVAETYNIVLRGSRLVLGISDGQASVKGEDSGPATSIIFTVDGDADVAADNLTADVS